MVFKMTRALQLLFIAIGLMMTLHSCAKKNYPFNGIKKQLTGQWKLVSSGGGFANLPETRTKDHIVVEFTRADRYRNFVNDQLKTETKYTINYVETTVTGTKKHVLVLEGEGPYVHFTVSGDELTLSGDHPDALYFKYVKVKE